MDNTAHELEIASQRTSPARSASDLSIISDNAEGQKASTTARCGATANQPTRDEANAGKVLTGIIATKDCHRGYRWYNECV